MGKRYQDQLLLILISFSQTTLQALAAAFPNIPTLWIHDLTKPDAQPIETLISLARRSGFSGLNLGLAAQLDVDLVPKIKKAGLQLCAWPVDTLELAQSLANAGADMLTTNRPDLLCGHLK